MQPLLVLQLKKYKLMKIRFNLLSPEQKKHLHTQKVFRVFMEQELHIIVILLLLVLGLFAMYFVLKTETNAMDEVAKKITENEQYQEIAQIREKFATIHKQVSRLERLHKNHNHWSQFFILLSENIPQTVMVESVEADKEKAIIHALALTREDVILMKEKFGNVEHNGEKCFTDIVVPESELTVPVDVLFTMTFKINTVCLK